MVAYTSSLRDRLRANLAAHDIRAHPLDGRRHAAVALVVVDSDADAHGHDPLAHTMTPALRREWLADLPGTINAEEFTGTIEDTAGGAALLLTRRPATMPDHPGQYALPGGRIEVAETAETAARREVAEEVGLDNLELLGQLDDYPTRSGYVITPFVFWAGADAEPTPDPREVASLHRIAIRELLRPDSPRFVPIAESDRPVIQLRIGGDFIHAPTGAVMHQFRAVAYEGRSERVDHYEQPVFAWR